MGRRLGSALITISLLAGGCGSGETSPPAQPTPKGPVQASPTPPPPPRPAAAPADQDITPPAHCKPSTADAFQSAASGNEEVRSVIGIATALHFDTSPAGIRAIYDCTKGGPTGWAIRYKAGKPEDKDGMLWWMTAAPSGRQAFFSHGSGDHTYLEFRDTIVHIDKGAKSTETTARDGAAKPPA
jgi:hypothetical protein